MRVFLLVLLLASLWKESWCAPPNIVLFIADDVGYGDMGFNGNPTIYTPTLDRLASEGMTLKKMYSTPLCSPSRAEIMTGRYFVRSGVYPGVINCCDGGGMNVTETTLPQVLKSTPKSMYIGKWHLGVKQEFWPLQRGFDHAYFLPTSANQGPSFTNVRPPDQFIYCSYLALVQDNTVIQQPTLPANLSGLFRQQAMNYIANSNKSQPFLLVVASDQAHVNVSGQAYSSPRSQGSNPLRGIYGDALADIDWVVGGIASSLVAKGIDNDTLFVFVSDNGAQQGSGVLNFGSVSPFQAIYSTSFGNLLTGKYTTWEGGIRVPAFVRWPGKVPPNTDSPRAFSLRDLLPTFAKIAGVSLPPCLVLDGTDASPYWLSTPDSSPGVGALFHWRAQPCNGMPIGVNAITINGTFKVHFVSHAFQVATCYVHDPPLVFRVDMDPEESVNLTPQNFPGYAAVNLSAQALLRQHLAALSPLPPQQIGLTNYQKDCVCGSSVRSTCFWGQ